MEREVPEKMQGQLGVAIVQVVQATEETRYTTAGVGRWIPVKRKVSMTEKFLVWLISWMLPGFHLAKNPPKGYKRPRKVRKEEKK